MNDSKTLEERQSIVRGLISIELNELKNQGYNLISKQREVRIDTAILIHPERPFIAVLRQSYDSAGFSDQTLLDIRSVLKYVEKSAIHLQ